MSAIYYARLQPYAPRKGAVVRSFTTHGIHFRGGLRPDWYKISEEQKNELEQLTQNPDDPHSRPLMQFANEEGMQAIDTQESSQLLAAMQMGQQSILDPKSIPRARVVDAIPPLASGAQGRGSAIPPQRDVAPSVTETASLRAPAKAPQQPEPAHEEAESPSEPPRKKGPSIRAAAPKKAPEAAISSADVKLPKAL